MAQEHLTFNEGEVEVQTRLGVHEQVMTYAPRVIRDYMPDQHRDFYQQLPLLFVGSIDEKGRPWASAVFGQPGFIQSPDPRSLHIGARPTFGDPLGTNLRPGTSLGFLGLEHHSRRRNRLSGKVVANGVDGFRIQVDQSFGNCPQYIHARSFEVLPQVAMPEAVKPTERFFKLTQQAKRIISKSTSFFIASYYQEDETNPSHGADVSHRGGNEGFVRISGDDLLTYPEFAGNNHYNTLGNLHKNPVAGLLFLDFENGDILYLTCQTEILWEPEQVASFQGARQFVQLRVTEGMLVEGAMPLRWQSIAQAPDLRHVGTWGESRPESRWRSFQIAGTRQESATIKTLRLEPVDGKPVPLHQPGQFLPIRLRSGQWSQAAIRSYTLTNRPDGRGYEISVKREALGKVSSYLHDHLSNGGLLEAGKPGGKFLLEQDHRPVVLISAGVGITPMISMLDQLAQSARACKMKVWFFHGTQNSETHAFRHRVDTLKEALPHLQVVYSYSKPLSTDILGEDFYHCGRIDGDLLKAHLPLDDYQFYICGPNTFMEDVRTQLQDLGVDQERMHQESFGKSSKKKHSQKPAPSKNAEPQLVTFAQSGVVATWTPRGGSLLDVAEAAGVQPPFSCRSGQCGSCVTKVRAGRVAYTNGEPDSLAPNEALLCVAHPHPDEKTRLVLEV